MPSQIPPSAGVERYIATSAAMEGGQSPTVTTTITLWFCLRNTIGSVRLSIHRSSFSRQPFYFKET